MWRIKYYDDMGLVDISFGIESEVQANAYAEEHSKELTEKFKHKVTYKVIKDKED